MSFIKQNQTRILAICVSILSHLFIFVIFSNRGPKEEPQEEITEEVMVEFDKIEEILDNVGTSDLTDENPENVTEANPQPKAVTAEAPPLAAFVPIDTVPIPPKPTPIVEVKTEAPPVPSLETDSTFMNLRADIGKKDSAKQKHALSLADQQFIKDNYKTIMNLKKVYAFAKKAKEMQDRLDAELKTIHDPGEKKAAIKRMEKEVWDNFEKAARTMSTSQGRLLLKLLARETGKTGYSIVREYKGAIPAIFWQGVAQMFKQNLKTTYDSTGEDALLEKIVHKYERKELDNVR